MSEATRWPGYPDNPTKPASRLLADLAREAPSITFDDFRVVLPHRTDNLIRILKSLSSAAAENYYLCFPIRADQA